MTTGLILEVAGMFFIPLLIVIGSVYIGEFYGEYKKKKDPDVPQTSVGSVVGAVLGLLAFMLAFTFQIAANHFDARKGLILEEATNIRKMYLQAGLIPEPICSQTKKLMIEYTDLRVDLAKDQSKLASAMSQSDQILDTLWKYSEELAARDRSSEIYAMFTGTVNELIDNYNHRLAYGLMYRIPPAVIWVLIIITVFSMLVLGYQFGISGRGSFKINMILAVIFAIVMFLILALDRPDLGIAKVNQKPMFSLQEELHRK